MKSFKLWVAVTLLLVLSGILLSATAFASDGDDKSETAIMVSEPSVPVLSVAVRDLDRSSPDRTLNREEINPLRNPGLFKSDLGLTGTFTQKQDPLAAKSLNSKLTPATLFDFEGLGTDGYTPPDTVGEVGPNHYVQMVNVSFAIFEKTGANVVPDTPFTDLFAGSGLTACESENDGDPIVVYDEIADRWLLSQFAVSSGTRMCIAISQTANPTGAYYLYQFDMPDFPDYFKFGVWSDAYYMGTNTGFPNQYYAYAFDRASMLSGSPATYQYANGYPNFLLPADLDGGMTNPPPPGSPGYFYTMLSDGYTDHPAGVDRLALYEFDVDWTTPANSTFGLVQELPIAAYNYTVCGFFVGDCIPQPGTSQGLDSLSYWPMWRFAYRNLGSYEAMVGNFTVDLDGTDKAAIRWFELQKTDSSWTLYQEGTYAPDSDHRWMGSIAMDGSGNIALGYSVSSSTTLPAIRYTVHEVGDPIGSMQAEQQIIQSAGVHTSINRWGDYSSMNVDPVDNCTFWYTNQYDTANNAGYTWHTRVGVFQIPSCTGSLGDLGILSGQVSNALNDDAITGALVMAEGITSTGQTTTNSLGYYTHTLHTGSYFVTAQAYGFQPVTVSNVEIFSGTTTTQDFALTPAFMYTVDGTVTDANTGWPLYAHLSISGDPFDPPVAEIWTDPISGYYQIDLAEGITYTFDVEAWVPGYLPAGADVGPLSGDATADFSLDVDVASCTAPGYSQGVVGTFYDGFESGYGNWTMNGLWNAEAQGDTCGSQVAPFPSPTNAAYYGQDGVCTYATGGPNSGALTMASAVLLPAASQLTYQSFEQTECGGNCNYDDRYVQISTDNGATWTNLGEASTEGSWYQNAFDLSAYGGLNAQIRFNFDSGDEFNNAYFGWMIDDVAIEALVCIPPLNGSLIVGNVYDENTQEALNGAVVENENGYMAEALATPLDDGVEDGFYSIFSPSGNKTFTATLSAPYHPDVDQVGVTTGDTIRHDFYLPSPSVSVNPVDLEVTLVEGYSMTIPLHLENNGSVETGFKLVEVSSASTTLMLGVSSSPVDSPIESDTSMFSAAGWHEFIGPILEPQVSEGAVNLVLDDGSQENSIGLTAGGQFIWLNRFTPDPAMFPFTLTEVLMYFGSTDGINIGESLDIYIYEDMDGDGNPGTGAVYLGSVNGVTIQSLDGWSAWALPTPIDILTPGDVLVAAVNRTAGTTAGEFPAALDQTASQGRSWVGIYAAGNPADPPVLPADQSWGIVDSLGFSGNWMIRGSGDTFGDIPWLYTDPVTGTLASDSVQIIDVTFDTLTYTVGTYTGTLRVKSDDPVNKKIEVPVTMHVEAVEYDIEFTAENDHLSGEPGSVVTYTVWVKNSGNLPDSFDIAAGTHTWDLDLLSSTGPLAPAESQSVEITISIPPDADDGDSDSVIITASSQGNPAVKAEIMLTTEAIIEEYWISLPLVSK